jgi:hypothetical protein
LAPSTHFHTWRGGSKYTKAPKVSSTSTHRHRLEAYRPIELVLTGTGLLEGGTRGDDACCCVGVAGLSGPVFRLKTDEDDDLEREIYGLGAGFGGGSSIIGVDGVEMGSSYTGPSRKSSVTGLGGGRSSSASRS